MTLSHQGFRNSRTMIYLYPMLRTSTEASTAISKVHQKPGVSLCPAVAFLALSYYKAFFFKHPSRRETLPCTQRPGESQSQKKKGKTP